MNWATQTETENITGILLWDLSTAFDTLDCEILCSKLVLYGFQSKTVEYSFHNIKQLHANKCHKGMVLLQCSVIKKQNHTTVTDALK